MYLLTRFPCAAAVTCSNLCRCYDYQTKFTLMTHGWQRVPIVCLSEWEPVCLLVHILRFHTLTLSLPPLFLSPLHLSPLLPSSHLFSPLCLILVAEKYSTPSGNCTLSSTVRRTLGLFSGLSSQTGQRLNFSFIEQFFFISSVWDWVSTVVSLVSTGVCEIRQLSFSFISLH